MFVKLKILFNKKVAFYLSFILFSVLFIKLDILFLWVKIIRIRKINNNNFISLKLEIFGSKTLITFSFIKDITNTVREAKIEDKEEYLNIKATVIQVNINSNVKL